MRCRGLFGPKVVAWIPTGEWGFAKAASMLEEGALFRVTTV